MLHCTRGKMAVSAEEREIYVTMHLDRVVMFGIQYNLNTWTLVGPAMLNQRSSDASLSGPPSGFHNSSVDIFFNRDPVI